MPETPYAETEALLHALSDAEVDSGNTDEVDQYLREHLNSHELLALAAGAELLAERCDAIWRERKEAAAEVRVSGEDAQAAKGTVI